MHTVATPFFVLIRTNIPSESVASSQEHLSGTSHHSFMSVNCVGITFFGVPYISKEIDSTLVNVIHVQCIKCI